MKIFEGLVFSFVGIDINLLLSTTTVIKEHGGDIYRPPAACFGPSKLKANYIITGTNDITKHDILTKLNCKDIDDNVMIVTIQFIYDCIESNKVFDETETSNYIVKPKIVDTIIIDDDDDDDDDDIGIKKRSIVEHNTSNKKATHSEAQRPFVITDDDINIRGEVGKWSFNGEKTVMFKLHGNLNIHNRENVEMIAFDMDGTLIDTKSGKIFPVDEHDWRMWHANVITTLKRLHDDGKYLAIISNQGLLKKNGVLNHTKINELQFKVDNLAKTVGIPFDFICSITDDLYRKPYPGMWHLLMKLRGDAQFISSRSMYVGDAAGREQSGNRKKDFSDTDYKLAVNVGVPFQTPEKFFLNSSDRLHVNLPSYGIKFSDMTNDHAHTHHSILKVRESQEIVMLCGPPASGKSTIATSYFSRYGRVNQDTLKSIDKCLSKAKEYLDRKEVTQTYTNQTCNPNNTNTIKSIVIDNTNLDIATRQKWIKLAEKHSVPIRAISLKLPKDICVRLAKFRKVSPDTRVEDKRDIPTIAMNTFFKDIDTKYPKATEGFTEVLEIKSFNPILPEDERVFALFNSVV